MSHLFFTYFLSFSESEEGLQHPPITIDVTFVWSYNKIMLTITTALYTGSVYEVLH